MSPWRIVQFTHLAHKESQLIMNESQVIEVGHHSPRRTLGFVKQRNVVIKLQLIAILGEQQILTITQDIVRTIPSDRTDTHNLHTGLDDTAIRSGS